MAISRSEAISRIESQRRAIREHIEKFNRYPVRQDKEYALKTIYRCQNEIRNIKDRCSSYIESSWEDTWTAPYYALNKDELLELREELLEIKSNDESKGVQRSLKR